MGTGATAVFLAVVAARFVVPLFIPRFPLPAIIAALVLDGVDQTIFQAFGYDPPGYQGYDKAMDMYYLAIAFLSTKRNWTCLPAVRVAAFLYFYRLVGVVAFELTDWRPLLLIFPNTFEYFFIAYELVRLRRNPDRYNMRFWIITAGAIWIFVKLPQEWWIHIAQLDVTDMLAEYPWLGPVVAVVLVLAAWVLWVFVRPRLSSPDWPWRIQPEPLPEEIDTAAERDHWIASNRRLLSAGTGEKVLLVGLLSVVYGQVLPGLRASSAGLFLAVAVFVVVNAAVILLVVRRARSIESVYAAFAARVLLNVVLVVLADWLLGRVGGALDLSNALFFVILLSLLTLLDDRYSPVAAFRATHYVNAAGRRAPSGTNDRG
jgi:hypothetical protein